MSRATVPVAERGEVFGDAVVATAILGPPAASHVPTITGESCRLREKRRAGVLPVPAPPAVQAAGRP